MANKRLKKNILEVVDNQLRDNDPSFVREIYEHLMVLTGSGQQAKEMIGAVVVEEIFDIMKKGEAFDEGRYHDKLNTLFNQFNENDVKMSGRIAAHPFCQMQWEYDEIPVDGVRGDKCGENIRKRAEAFWRHWIGGLREWLREKAQKNGKKIALSDIEDDVADDVEMINFLQDIDIDLLNAGMYEERISYARDILDIFSWEDDHFEWSNFYSYIGESMNSLGKVEESDRFFEDWLEKEPDNIQCVNAYLNCLCDYDRKEYGRAKELLEKYLTPETKITFGNDILLARAEQIYGELGDTEKVSLYHRKSKQYAREQEEQCRRSQDKSLDHMIDNLFAHAPRDVVYTEPIVRTEKKIYPNDPCPCGSGKKYKKCCGRK